MRNRIYILNLLFLFPMWMSKTLQPLFWEMEGKLFLFSASYVAMAIAGTFSLWYANLIRRSGIKRGLVLGFLLYGAGLILRAYPVNFPLAILTGLIAGIGASVTGLALKGLILEIDEEKRKSVILQTDNIYTLSQSLGAMAAGLLVSILALFMNNGFQWSLVITGLLTISALTCIPNHSQLASHSLPETSLQKTQIRYSFPANKILYSTIFIAFFINGACWAIFLPLIPIYLKGLNMTPAQIGLVISGGVIAGFLLKNIYIIINKHAANNISLGVFTVLTASAISLSFLFFGRGDGVLFGISIIAFYMFRTVLALIIDLIEMHIAGRGNAMSVFGIRQTAFLSGDVAGGIAMPFFFKSGVLIPHVLLLVSMIAIASFLIASCAKLSEKHVWKATLN
ncbi:TPA: sugar MFS transporter [Citrobacter freundii]